MGIPLGREERHPWRGFVRVCQNRYAIDNDTLRGAP
jgi:hypothetical protein